MTGVLLLAALMSFVAAGGWLTMAIVSLKESFDHYDDGKPWKLDMWFSGGSLVPMLFFSVLGFHLLP